MKKLIAASLVLATVLPAVPALAADDAVDLATFQAESRARMLQADADKDGKLSAAELANAPRPGGRPGGQAAGQDGGQGRGPGGPGGQARMMQMADTNGDGFVDAAEIDAMSARRFTRMDENGDGKLSAQEREGGRSWRPGGERGGEQGAPGAMEGHDMGGHDMDRPEN